jgi:hypothetical protein
MLLFHTKTVPQSLSCTTHNALFISHKHLHEAGYCVFNTWCFILNTEDEHLLNSRCEKYTYPEPTEDDEWNKILHNTHTHLHAHFHISNQVCEMFHTSICVTILCCDQISFSVTFHKILFTRNKVCHLASRKY